MAVILIDLLSGVFLAAAGVFAGWWLRGSQMRKETGRIRDERRQAREVLTRVHDLAGRVAADVGQHNSRVEEINQGLSGPELNMPDEVMLAVNQLLEANNKMQEQLDSAQQKLEEQAQQIQSHAVAARTDVLTQLPNRRAFDAEMDRGLAEYARRGKVFSLMMIDVDHFKRFNDDHGHQAGDEVLRSVAAVLRTNVRPMDIPARYGGEEFAVVMPDTSAGDARPFVEEVRRLIDAHRCQFGEDMFHVTASLGMAQLGPGESATELIHRADEALYAAKEAGRNCAFWHDGQTSLRITPAMSTRPIQHEANTEPQPVEVPSATVPQASPPVHVGQPDEGAASLDAVAEATAETVAETTHQEVGDSEVDTAVPEEPMVESEAPDEAAQPVPEPEVSADPAATAGQCRAGGEEETAEDPEEKRISQMAPYSRTGLCTALHRVLQEWPDLNSPPCVVLVSVDEHAAILNQRGQQVGNLVLHATLQFLTAASRDVGLVAHYNTATFAMLFPSSEHGYVINMAERLRQAIAKCVLPINQDQIQFTISLGGARAKLGDDTQKLLRRTEEALDAARKAGGNTSFFHNGQWCETVGAAMERVE